ncbi:MAG: (2Fe-2S)-binding protein [Pseudomonadota bacterium]
MTKFTLNGTAVETTAPPETPLLWAIREDLGLTGTKYGCGVGMCGACTVHVDGDAQFSCLLTVADVSGQSVVTIEGLSETNDHPLQTAWIAEQVPQCGYCQSGQIMRAADLLSKTPKPTPEEIRAAMSQNLCRCGTYTRIERAVARAAREA